MFLERFICNTTLLDTTAKCLLLVWFLLRTYRKVPFAIPLLDETNMCLLRPVACIIIYVNRKMGHHYGNTIERWVFTEFSLNLVISVMFDNQSNFHIYSRVLAIELFKLYQICHVYKLTLSEDNILFKFDNQSVFSRRPRVMVLE